MRGVRATGTSPLPWPHPAPGPEDSQTASKVVSATGFMVSTTCPRQGKASHLCSGGMGL